MELATKILMECIGESEIYMNGVGIIILMECIGESEIYMNGVGIIILMECITLTVYHLIPPYSNLLE